MSLVQRTQLGRVLRLHLNSPENLNALSGAMLSALSEAFQPEQTRSASVVLLTSAGRHFGAGHDLAEISAGRAEPELFRQCSEVMKLVANCEVPVVAAVQGCAFAAGCQLAASSDVVLAARNARFATPGTKIGLFCSTPSVALTRATTAKVAADMLFSARELSADEALQAGLVSRLLPEGVALEDEALRLCHRIAEAPRDVLVNGKALLQAQRGKSLDSAYELASTAMEHGMEHRHQVAQEGIAAFLQKRPPHWPSEDSEIERAVALASRGIAVVGASPNPERESNRVFAALQRDVPAFPVNPQATEVCGAPAFKDLDSVSAPFAIVDVFRSGPGAAEAVDAAIALAATRPELKAVWLQEGVRAPEAEARARAAGLYCVADRCLMVELRRRAAGGSSGPAAKL